MGSLSLSLSLSLNSPSDGRTHFGGSYTAIRGLRRVREEEGEEGGREGVEAVNDAARYKRTTYKGRKLKPEHDTYDVRKKITRKIRIKRCMLLQNFVRSWLMLFTP